MDSTNNYALRRVHEGLALDHTAIFAHDQYAGKGQRGKTWTGEEQLNLALSVILHPSPLQPRQQFLLSASVATAGHRFLKKYLGEETSIKWPNDLYWQDRKAGGILIENVIQGNQWKWAVIGIGINVNQTSFSSTLANPVSMKQITGREFKPLALARELAEEILESFERLSSGGEEEILDTYRGHLYRKNKPTRFRKGTRVFEGTVKDVTTDGRLVVGEEMFEWGEIEWVIN